MAVVNIFQMSALAEKTIIVTADGALPPTAKIIASKVEGPAPLTVSLSCDCKSGDAPIVSYSWSYGDGEFTQEAAATHVYANAGGVVARLTVTDSRGLTATAEQPIAVDDGNFKPPYATARANPTKGDAPLAVQFISEFGDPEGLVVARKWILPDGTTVTDMDPVRTFTSVGTVSARLEVTNDRGLTAVDTVTIDVTRNGALPPKIISTPSGTAVVGQSWLYDEDGTPAARGTRPLTWDLGKLVNGQTVNAPDGMQIDPSTGHITWTPSAAQVGELPVTLRATNAAGTDSQDFTVVVESDAPARKGCGCDTGSAPMSGFALVLLALLKRGRTRANSN
jgi:MYXO-CTERM domain-containing protein